MKQKALPAGTAQALGGGGEKRKKKKKKVWVYWEACAYGQQASFISISMESMKKHKNEWEFLECFD